VNFYGLRSILGDIAAILGAGLCLALVASIALCVLVWALA
jgi:hypothetical protein